MVPWKAGLIVDERLLITSSVRSLGAVGYRNRDAKLYPTSSRRSKVPAQGLVLACCGGGKLDEKDKSGNAAVRPDRASEAAAPVGGGSCEVSHGDP